MDQREFIDFQDKFWEEIRSLTSTKGEEYKTNSDQLSNFKTAAAQTGVDPVTALFLYMNKHYNSVSNYVKDRQTGQTRSYSESIHGRLHDMVLYSILMSALITELDGPVDPKPFSLDSIRYDPSKLEPCHVHPR